MASAKRKQDEKHLKILRELVSLSGNKECFDCSQRGPTYVNMTIGSFVCTSCSGLLRGLTPPHRVKSISMATFTSEEIEFIKERGNEYCKRIWLGLMSSSNPLIIDTKDEQKMKDLMSAKYEHKRYYLDPTAVNDNQKSTINSNNNNNKNVINNNISNSNSNLRSNQISIPRVPQVGTLPMISTPNQKKKQSTSTPEPVNAFSPDFIADFSQTPDPFVPVPTPVSNNTKSRLSDPIEPQPSFANFDNNPVFDSSNNTATLNQIGKSSMQNFNGIRAPPSEDRYAALKDLDCLMKKTQLKDETSPSVSPAWITNVSNSPWTNTSNNQPSMISNPFTGNDLWGQSLHLINNNNNNNNNGMQTTLDNINPANPFRQTQFPINNESQWIRFGSQSTADVLPSSQLMTTPLSGKVWPANPFMVGNATRSSSKNPFL